MSGNITPVTATPATAPTKHDARTEKLRHAASEFEGILVKQLLKAAKLGASNGEEKANGYADMAVDALASGIQRAGGLGLARRIEEALSSRSHPDLGALGAIPHTPAAPGTAAPGGGGD
jgi:Rod binding domain-containing protein